MKTQRAKVLFICIGNSCRSPMAEAIARKDALDLIDASSAGLAPLGFVADMTTETLVKNGYAADGLASKPISPEAWESADIVINMSGREREFAFRGFRNQGKVEDWLIDDPYGDATKYQGTYEAIRRRVAELARCLKEKSAPRDKSSGHAASNVRTQ